MGSSDRYHLTMRHHVRFLPLNSTLTSLLAETQHWYCNLETGAEDRPHLSSSRGHRAVRIPLRLSSQPAGTAKSAIAYSDVVERQSLKRAIVGALRAGTVAADNRMAGPDRLEGGSDEDWRRAMCRGRAHQARQPTHNAVKPPGSSIAEIHDDALRSTSHPMAWSCPALLRYLAIL